MGTVEYDTPAKAKAALDRYAKKIRVALRQIADQLVIYAEGNSLRIVIKGAKDKLQAAISAKLRDATGCVSIARVGPLTA